MAYMIMAYVVMALQQHVEDLLEGVHHPLRQQARHAALRLFHSALDGGNYL